MATVLSDQQQMSRGTKTHSVTSSKHVNTREYLIDPTVPEMKTKILQSGNSGPLTAFGWNTCEEIIYSGDDRDLFKLNVANKEVRKFGDSKISGQPFGISPHPKSQTGATKGGLERILITCADGKFHLLGRNGRFEKSVVAHNGAILSGRWNQDGTSFFTAGEDGCLKIWSQTGMLRTSILQGALPVMDAAWRPDSNQIIYTQGKYLIIKPITLNGKSNKWKGHDGCILSVAWNPSFDLIVSGSEDCRYKIWDSFGTSLFCSLVQDYPITALCWSPNGDLFAAGFFNSIFVCNKAGWCYSSEKHETGSIYDLHWSPDGTQLACACANGRMLVIPTIQRKIKWLKYEAVNLSRKVILFRDTALDQEEKLEFSDRVTSMSSHHEHLLVITASHCHIYHVNQLNTPLSFELKEGSVLMILQTSRNFLLAEKTSISIYSYDGRLLTTAKWPGVKNELLNESCISLSPEVVAVRDHVNEKTVHILEIGSTSAGGSLTHSQNVSCIALSQAGSLTDRHLALIDENRDLYVATVSARGSSSYRVEKLGPMVKNICWNSRINAICGFQDTALVVWYFPAVLFIDPRLLRKTISIRDAGEFGKNPSLISFDNSHVKVRRSDGATVFSSISPFVSSLHNFVLMSRWSDAVRLCRTANDETAWACLAAMAIHARQADVAEESYAAIDQADKVFSLQYIKSLPNHVAQLSEMTLLSGYVQEAEGILLKKDLLFRAILMNLQIHNWNRALELAVKHKTYLELVLWFREKYLKSFDKAETNEAFLMHNPQEHALSDEKALSILEFESSKERSKTT